MIGTTNNVGGSTRTRTTTVRIMQAVIMQYDFDVRCSKIDATSEVRYTAAARRS
jgi:hypothetical protein